MTTCGAVRGAGAARGAACRRPGERGHLLIILMVGISVMLIMMTVAAQSWTFRIRREMEAELIFRGEQYVHGLERFKQATGGFPLGDLKVLVNKTPEGERFMRKLYRNPFHKKGEWQYLFLHPGGTGFINPCANATSPAAFASGGMLPIEGMQMIGGNVSGGQVVAPATNLPGQNRGGRSSKKKGGSLMSDLSAMDPEAFKLTGVSGMNLPIVGVVNCEQAESIRTYQGQTWLSNWAFTPLAQGEFGGNAMGRGSGKLNVKSGLGMTGAQSYSLRDSANVPGRGITLDDDNRPEPGRRRPPPSDWIGKPDAGGGQGDEDDSDRGNYQWRRDQGGATDEGDPADANSTAKARRRGKAPASGKDDPGKEKDPNAPAEDDEEPADDDASDEDEGEDEDDEGDGDEDDEDEDEDDGDEDDGEDDDDEDDGGGGGSSSSSP